MSKDLNKAMDDLFKETDKVFKHVDQVFKIMEKRMEEAEQESWESINKRAKWEPHISWIPRKIGKRWYWHSPIYRKWQFDGSNGHFIYGTEFDVLKASR
jgi:hypothetical protein